MEKEEKSVNTFNANKDVRILLFSAAGFAVLFVVLTILKQSVAISEWWSRTIGRAWIFVVGNFTKLFGFSLFEVLLIAAIIGIVAWLVFLIIFLVKGKKRAVFKLILILVCCVFGCLSIYSGVAGFAYNRAELPVELDNGEITKEEVYDIAQRYVDKINEVALRLETDEKGAVVCPYMMKELSEKLIKEYERLDGEEYNGYFSSFTTRAKSSLFSKIMTEMHITGMFFAPTGEAHINTSCPSCSVAVTAAHEIAHSKGIMREGDANLLAYYIALTSDDDYLLFAGLFELLNSFLDSVTYYSGYVSFYNELYSSLNSTVSATIKEYNAFWNSHKGLVELEETLNNAYLKSNGVENGTDSYSDSTTSDVVFDYDNLDENGSPTVIINSFSDAQLLVFKLAQDGIL